MFAVASAQPSRTQIFGAVRATSRFGITRCRLRYSRSLCSFARQLVDLIRDNDFVGNTEEQSSNEIDDDEGEDGESKNL